MKLFHFLTLLISLLLSNIALGQRNCGTDERQNELLKDPVFQARYEAIEEYTARFSSRQSKTTAEGVVVVPVVVHILYKDESQNISDAQVQSQINVLNQDFRKLNSNFLTTTPEEFQPFGADVEIEFELADFDPNGNTTNGIVRQSISSSFDVGDNYYTASTAWDTNQYLNIWVGELGGGELGFAWGPSFKDEPFDGVVISYLFFGTTGTATFPFNLGRTATHEVGHYFNVAHLWGASNDPTNCVIDDGIADTPNQAGPNFGTPTFPITQASDTDGSFCPQSAPNGPMFMNYMNYTNDVAMSLFTLDQKTRMQAALTGPRSGLINSIGFCNGTVYKYYRDLDQDTLGDLNNFIILCDQETPPEGFVENSDDLDDTLKTLIAPNPIGLDNSFRISSPYLISKVAIFDIIGKKVFESSPSTFNPIIHLNRDLPSGIYFSVIEHIGRSTEYITIQVQ